MLIIVRRLVWLCQSVSQRDRRLRPRPAPCQLWGVRVRDAGEHHLLQPSPENKVKKLSENILKLRVSFAGYSSSGLTTSPRCPDWRRGTAGLGRSSARPTGWSTVWLSPGRGGTGRHNDWLPYFTSSSSDQSCPFKVSIGEYHNDDLVQLVFIQFIWKYF